MAPLLPVHSCNHCATDICQQKRSVTFPRHPILITLLLLLLILLLFPLGNSIRNSKCGYGCTTTRIMQGKVIRLLIQEGTEAKQVRQKDGKREGQIVGEGTIQAYEQDLGLITAGRAGQWNTTCGPDWRVKPASVSRRPRGKGERQAGRIPSRNANAQTDGLHYPVLEPIPGQTLNVHSFPPLSPFLQHI